MNLYMLNANLRDLVSMSYRQIISDKYKANILKTEGPEQFDALYY